jgi:type 1 glutamine amidotransferase
MLAVLVATLLLPNKDFNVLVFSKTAGFRHDSIETGVQTLKDLGKENGFKVDATEDATAFDSDDNLRKYKVIVFLSTTGDVLDMLEEKAMEEWMAQGGHGYVGIHSAADTEYDWKWYGQLVGAYFKSHPAIQEAKVKIENHDNPATAHLGDEWTRTDEWYDYKAVPEPDIHILARLDTSSYQGHSMGDDHPIAWCHEFGGGRAFYTGMGHTKESYADPVFQKHLIGAIRWAAGNDK